MVGQHLAQGAETGPHLTERVGGFGVFGKVHAGRLSLVADAEAHCLVDDPGDDGGAKSGQQESDDDGGRLGDELLDAAAVEEAAALAVHGQGDETQRQGADEACPQVDTDHVQRVVKAKAVLEVHEHAAGGTRHQAQSDCCHRADVGAGRSDCNQAGDNA